MERKFPVILTFDLDGETLWRCRDPENAHRPVILSQGRYGPETAMPRILKLLRKFGIQATFFVPGFTMAQYPELIREIDAAGHEIGNHGWSHTYPDQMESRKIEEKEYDDASNLLECIIRKRPKGYRSPAWEFSPHTLSIIEKMEDFQYSSNMMDCDEIRYLNLQGKASRIVEIPVSWILDDAAFWLYSLRTPGKSMQPLDSVEDYWIREFDGLLNEFIEAQSESGRSELCFVLTCHPQIIGRHARLRVLENLIRHIAASGKAEFMTGSEAAAKYKSRNPQD